MLNEEEFNALITLLDDPDKEVNSHVIGKLKSFGVEIIPSLETAWESSPDTNLQVKIEDLIQTIRSDTLCNELQQWAADGAGDLLEGTIIISKYQYPDIDAQDIRTQIDKIKQGIWLELNFNLTPIEQVNVFNHIFYRTYGFSGNTANVLDPMNGFINNVLESKRGNTLSLGILYLIIARQLEMPVYGVNLPQHFILAYMKNTIENLEDSDLRKGILFYINTFNKGMIFTRNEIKQYLKKIKLDPNPSFFLPCDHVMIVQELIKSLITSFEDVGANEKVGELKTILASLD